MGLKLFPAEALSPKVLAAWRSVMSRDEAVLIPTGGINAENVGAWWDSGADGIGVGSAVFDPAGDADETHRRAKTLVSAINRARA